MEALEYELHGEGFHEIDFTTVCPTFVQTAMINNFTYVFICYHSKYGQSIDFRIQYRNISILTSDYVAERIVDAIELNQRVCLIVIDNLGPYTHKIPWESRINLAYLYFDFPVEKSSTFHIDDIFLQQLISVSTLYLNHKISRQLGEIV